MGSTPSPSSHQEPPLLGTAHAQGPGSHVECSGSITCCNSHHASVSGDYFDPQFTDEDAESRGERACPAKFYSSDRDFNPRGQGPVL